jgi:hypothetical protein
LAAQNVLELHGTLFLSGYAFTILLKAKRALSASLSPVTGLLQPVKATNIALETSKVTIFFFISTTPNV